MQPSIFLSGFLAKDCEKIQGKGPVDLIRFSIPVKEPKGSSSEERTTWYSCTMPDSKISEHLKKGRFVFVAGSLRVSTFEKDGKVYTNLDVWVRDLDLAPQTHQENPFS